jgi:uncharacterized protein (DUF1015 family)
MAEGSLAPLVAPFVGERYTALDRLSDLIAPPYDVIGPDDRKTLAAREAHNVVHVTLPEGRPGGYAVAAKLLERWRGEGVLERDSGPSVYVVQQEFLTPDGRARLRTGVIAGLHVEPYDLGRVRPHERTHAEPKADRLALARATATMPEAIFLLARDERGHLRRRLDGVTKHAPTVVAELDGVGIGLWKVGGVQAREIAHAVDHGPLYIADGHHRYETAIGYRQENPVATHIPALIVPVADPGLVARPTHRIVEGEAVDADALLRRLGERFAVEEREPELDPHGMLEGLTGREPAAVIALPPGRIYALTARVPSEEVLEIAVIERDVVQPLLQAAGRGATLQYSADPGAVFDALARGAAVGGVLVRPTPVERVLEVADARGVMPAKSTYFMPKVPSGLVWMRYA